MNLAHIEEMWQDDRDNPEYEGVSVFEYIRIHAFPASEVFEAGRDGTIEAPCGYEYPTYTDYEQTKL